jgi:hypothetical protein
MERMTPEQMEKMVHEALRSLPNRRAPASLEARVHAALEARAAIPWWHKSWAFWPRPVRTGFLVLCGAVMALIVLAGFYLQAGADSAATNQAIAPVLSGASRIMGVVRGIENYATLVVRHIPAVWLYGTVAFVAGVYAMLMGLGAAAYRTLWVHHA